MYCEDIWGDPIDVGETVIVSRPNAYGGSSYLEYCMVIKINPKSVSLRPINSDGMPRDNEAPFSLQKNRTGDRCFKVMRFKR